LADPSAPEDIFVVREAIIEAVLESFAPHLVLVDHEPAGLAGELCPALDRLRTKPSRPILVVGLRDITYGSAETRARWTSEGTYELLDQVYDRILVYGSQDVFDPIQAYGFSPLATAKTTFTGYIRQPGPFEPAAEIRQRLGAESLPLLVVTTGGGSDGGRLIRAYLEAVREEELTGAVSYVVAGPQLPESEWSELLAVAGDLPNLTLVRFCTDLVSHIAAADVVITMGGYNSVCEAVAAGKRPIVVPRGEGSNEQRLRAECLAALGVVTHLPQTALTPENLVAAIQAELKQRTSPPAILDFNGLERATGVLSQVLDD
jgi:predicted glycosyltransferase